MSVEGGESKFRRSNISTPDRRSMAVELVIIGGVAVLVTVIASIKVGRKTIMVVEEGDGTRHVATKDRSQSGAVKVQR